MIFLQNIGIQISQQNLKTISNFFNSKDYFLDYRHAEMTVDQLIDKESIQ